MESTKVANFTNVRNSRPVISLHGQMQTDKTHRMVDLEPMVHRHHLEAIFRTHLALMGIMRAIQVNVSAIVSNLYRFLPIKLTY